MKYEFLTFLTTVIDIFDLTLGHDTAILINAQVIMWMFLIMLLQSLAPISASNSQKTDITA